MDKRSNEYSKMTAWKRGRKKLMFISAVVVLIAILICLFSFNVFAESKVNRSLQQLIVVFRHGDRNPTGTYNSDPFKNYKWPNGLGALTNEGKLQLYTLGRLIRNYYNDFIPTEYFDDDVYVLSTDSSRCLMSAYTMLAGLFPPSEEQKWHPEIPWQPVPVHAFPRTMDSVLAGKKPCAKLDKEDDFARESPRIKKMDEDIKDLYAYLTLHTNETIDNVLNLELLYGVINVQKEHGLKLPDWTDSVFPDKMEIPMRTSLALFTDNDMMKRLRSGPLLKDIINNMKVKYEDRESKKLYLYSAHDITIVSFMRTLGFTELLRPEYGASFILELHNNGASPYVKALYWNDTKTELPTELQLPLCDSPCTLARFEESTKHLIPNDWETECGNL